MSGNGDTPARVSAIKLALMARKAREQAGSTLAADPIAIVGMGCRVPGGATDPESFWSFLLEARDTVTPVPADRWDAKRWHGEGLDATGRSIAQGASFLDSIDGFDAGYFGIHPREADQMDPQQRLFAEVATEAIEDAGLRFEDLRRSRTGVFVASYHNDYAQMLYRDPEAMDQRTLTGTLHSVLVNRLSYMFDLRGPSVSVDTACSASLVAVHLACQSLRTGESDIALAGGVSVMLSPELMVSMSRMGFLAPDGRCKTFDAGANGFGRGEGAGVIALKRLSDAVADRDRIWAVIRGSVVNQDGESTLLAAPNGQAQAALVRDALATSQVALDDFVYVETHGTGTELGDPIEVGALAETVGMPAPGRPDCLLGAVKANIGHLEAAAGVIGIIKTALVLAKGEAPAQPNFHTLNPHIDLSGTRLKVASQRQKLPTTVGAAAGGVSSFGVGGTNAHVVLEAPPAIGGQQNPVDESAIWTLPLSARSAAALQELALGWQKRLDAPGAPLSDLCFTAAQRRSHHRHRLAVTGTSREEMAQKLGRRVERGDLAKPHPKLCFVFCGQGPQRARMGLDLADADPEFARHLARCDAAILPITGWSLLEELARPEEETRLGETSVAQPALVAIQTGLAALLARRGLAPVTVIGHSIGEVSALEAAGILSLEEALRIACLRGRIMQEAEGAGGMASVPLDPEAARTLIAPHGDALSIAAANAPSEVVLSGATEALDAALDELAAKGISHRRLPVRYAFHSNQMAGFDTRLISALGGVATTGRPQARVLSTVTGGEITGADAGHIARGIRGTVHFAQTIRKAAQEDGVVFLEIGPHPVLGASIAACLEAAGASPEAIVPTLRRGQPGPATLAEAVARLYEFGHDPDWKAVLPEGGAVTSLPRYPWQHRRHWRKVRDTATTAGGIDTGHPLLGTRLAIAAEDVVVFDGGPTESAAWLQDHRIFGRAILPGTGAMELLAAAAAQIMGPQNALTEFAMLAPLPLPDPDEAALRWQVVARRREGESGAWSLKLVVPEAEPGDGARIIAEGHARPAETPPPADAPINEPPARLDPEETVPANRIEARFKDAGADFGPAFRLLADVRAGRGMATGMVRLPDNLAAQPHLIHPAALDAGVQLALLAAAGDRTGSWLPVAAGAVHLPAIAPGVVRSAEAVLQPSSDTTSLVADVAFRDSAGGIVARIEALRFAKADPGALEAATARRPQIYRTAWRTLPPASAPETHIGTLLIVASAGSGADLVAAFVSQGIAARRLEPMASDTEIDSALEWLIAADGPRRLIDLSTLSQDAIPAIAVESALARFKRLLSRPTGSIELAVATRGACSTGHESASAAVSVSGAALQAFYATAATEHPELAIRGIDLDPDDYSQDPAALASAIAACLARPAPARIALRGGDVLGPELERSPETQPPGPRALRPSDDGGIDGLRMTPVEVRPLRPGEIRIAVRTAGLNFRDVLGTLGLLPGMRPPLGVELAGEVVEANGDTGGLRPGDRVFGYAPGALAEEAITPANLLVRIPVGLSDEDAAGLTVAFGTALFGLDRLAGLKAGERVLIHAGAGGVGLAAIQIALSRGAVVYATAGSEDKRQMLRDMGVALALDSRSLEFEKRIAEATGGRGVDVVLNSLAGEFIPASVRTLAENGRFLELGKRDLMSPEAFAGMRPNGSYHVYDLGQRIEAEPRLLSDLLEEILAKLADGTLRPLPKICFRFDRAGDAMRWMAAARHVGKIVLRMPPRPAPRMRQDATYWITGGLGGLGLYTARWLTEQGARHLVLTGRNAPDSTTQDAIAEIEAMGAEVRVIRADVAVEAEIDRAMATISAEMPPLRGIIHAAGALRDGPVSTRTADDAAAVLGGKLGGALALDRLTRNTPLDIFILYSAAATTLGSPGQTLYAAANAGLDALAEARHREGLPALSIAWGRWEGAGMAARLAESGNGTWMKRGLGAITSETGFAPVQSLLATGDPVAMVAVADWHKIVASAPSGFDASLFAGLAGSIRSTGPTPTTPGHGLRDRLSGLSPEDAAATLSQSISEAAIEIIGLAPDDLLDPARPLKEIGLDSLMAIELRNTLVRRTGLDLSATLLFDYPSLSRLSDHLALRLGITPTATDPAANADPTGLDAMTDAELEALLEAELAQTAPIESAQRRDRK